MVEFASIIANKFYRDASSVDVEIDESEVKEFIKNNIAIPSSFMQEKNYRTIEL